MAKLLQQGHQYQKPFSKFYRGHYSLVSKFNVGLKKFLRGEGLSEPEFNVNLVYKFKTLTFLGLTFFPLQFRKIITRYSLKVYNLNVMRQSACLVFNSILVDYFAAFFNCTPVGRASYSMMTPTQSYLFLFWGWSFLSVSWPTGVQLVFLFCSGFSKLFCAQGSQSSGSFKL